MYLCPSDKKYACDWMGPPEDIQKHFKQQHNDLICDSDTIEIDHQVISENHLMIRQEGTFLIQTLRDDQSNLMIFVRFLGLELEAKNYIFDLDLKIDGFELEKSKFVFLSSGGYYLNRQQLKDEFGDFSCITASFSIKKIVAVPLRSLKRNQIVSMSMSTSIKPVTNITKRNSMIENKYLNTINEQDQLTCFFCDNLLKTPIFTCELHHNICINCNHDQEPNCKAPRTLIRNFELEQRYEQLKFSCKYQPYGCLEKITLLELKQHENKCGFCEYKCPIRDCRIANQFNFATFYDHIKLFHHSVKKIETSIAKFPKNYEMFLFTSNRGVFYCKSMGSLEFINWEVQFCGPEDRKFFLEMSFAEASSRNNKFVLQKRTDSIYGLTLRLDVMKKDKLKDKKAFLVVAT